MRRTVFALLLSLCALFALSGCLTTALEANPDSIEPRMHGVWLATEEWRDYAVWFREDGFCDISGPDLFIMNGSRRPLEVDGKPLELGSDVSVRYGTGLEAPEDFVLILKYGGKQPVLEEIPGKIEFASEDEMVIRFEYDGTSGESSLVPLRDAVRFRRVHERPRSVLLALQEYYKGRTALLDSLYYLAIGHFDNAVAHGPGYQNAYLRRAEAYAGLGDYDRALEDIGYIVERNPESLEANHLHARLLMAMGRDEEAAEVLGRASGMTSLNPKVFNNAAWDQIVLGMYPLAVENAGTAIAMDERSSYFDTRGWAHLLSGNFEQALADAAAAIELDKGAVFPRVLKFRAVEQLEDRETAMDELRAFADRPPGESTKRSREDWVLVEYILGDASLDDLRRHDRWRNFEVALR